MRRLIGSLGLLGMVSLLVFVSPARACPLCKEAIESTADNPEYKDDPFQEGRAYNTSIYLMVGMPYLLLFTVGFLIYRNYRPRPLPTEDQGESSCPPPSPGGPS